MMIMMGNLFIALFLFIYLEPFRLMPLMNGVGGDRRTDGRG